MAFTQNIKTSHDKPPVPTRDHDWSAWFDWASPDDDYFISGNGETEQAAVADLIQKAAEASDPRYCGEVVDMAAAFWGAPKWQPIETAPKDGTFFLVGWAQYVTEIAVWDCGTKQFVQHDGSLQPEPLDTRNAEWMPLPDAQKESEANA